MESGLADFAVVHRLAVDELVIIFHEEAQRRVDAFAVHDGQVFEIDDLLRDEAAWLFDDLVPERLLLFLRQAAAEDDAIAASLGDILDDEVVEVLERVVEVILEIRQVRRRVLENRLFVEIYECSK